MKKNILLCFIGLLGTLMITAQDTRTVFGKVTDGNAPMQNVTVQVLNTDKLTATTADGSYRIPVETGDQLQFSYVGMKTIMIRVEDVTRVLNPILIPDVSELDEVVVTKSKRTSQRDLALSYDENRDIIRTAFGYIDALRSPGRTFILTEVNEKAVTPCILDLLRNRWPSVAVEGDCGFGGKVAIRGQNTIFLGSGPVWDVDGLILNEIPLWLDPNNIKRLAVLTSLGQTVQYGGLGKGGVIVVNTVSGNTFRQNQVDHARLVNNFYKDNALDSETVKTNWPAYKKELYASTSLNEAQQKFDELVSTNANSPYFLLDAQNYFVTKWDSDDAADAIIANHFDRYSENPVLLKALAYQYQQQGAYEKANNAFKEVFLLRPNYAQSYLDIARSYRETGNVVKSAAMHARYDYLLEHGFMETDTTGIGPIMENEFANLMALEKDAIISDRKQKKLIEATTDTKGTKVVFEWNDGEAEFELQFVNPGKQYHTWKHSLVANASLIENEKRFGYTTMEEYIDDSLPGTWQVNVKYLGNKSLTPTYLKATVYHNYGTIAQRKEVTVAKLDIKDVNIAFLTIRSASAVAAK